MSIVIIYGPKASGKTTNAERMKRHYGCRRIVDGWDAFEDIPKLRDGDLALALDEPTVSIHGAIVIDIATALKKIGTARP